jgi:hypothetical protein
VLSGIVVFAGPWTVGAIAYPHGSGIEHPLGRDFNALWETAFRPELAQCVSWGAESSGS